MAKNVTGYTPPGQHTLGTSTASTIAGLDQRIFTVTLSGESANLLPLVSPATSPDKIALPLPQTSDLTEAVMLRSTFKQHFDAIVLDWTYVEHRTASELRKEGRWAFMRNISLLVDFTSGLNLYPDLRLCNNSAQYEESIRRISAVLMKMSTPVNASTHTMDVTFAADAIIAMHRAPENGRGYCTFLSIHSQPARQALALNANCLTRERLLQHRAQLVLSQITPTTRSQMKNASMTHCEHFKALLLSSLKSHCTCASVLLGGNQVGYLVESQRSTCSAAHQTSC